MNRIKNIVKHLLTLPWLILLIFSAWLSLEYVALGPFSYARTGDNLDSLIPRYVSNWASGNSYWQPAFSGGIDRLANAANSLDFINIMFLLFPVWLASGIIIFAAIFIGQYYFFLLCRKILQINRGASLLAGLFFGYSLVLIDIFSIMLGLAVLPLVLYYLEKIFFISKISWFKKISLGFLLGLIFSSCSSLLLTLPFAFVLIVFWFLVIRQKSIWQMIVPAFCLFVPAALAHVQEFWSLLSNVGFSQRGGGGDYFHAKIKHSLLFINKLFWGNWPVIVISFIGLLTVKKDRRIFYKLLFLVFVLLFVVLWFPWISTNFGQYFGPFRNFDFSRFSLFLPFFASLTAAFVIAQLGGFLSFTNDRNSGALKFYSIRSIVLLIIFGIIFSGTIFLKLDHAKEWIRTGSLKAHVYSPDINYIKDITGNDSPFRVGIVNSPNMQVMSSLSQFQGLESIDGYTNMTSEENTDFFKLVTRDGAMRNGLYLFSEGDNIAMLSASPAINESLLSLANVRFLFSSVLLDLPGFVLVSSPSSKNYPKRSSIEGWDKLRLRLEENFFGRKLLVYENKNFFPRFFLVKDFKTFINKEVSLVELGVTDVQLLRRTVFLNKKEVDSLDIMNLNGQTGKIFLREYFPDEIRLQVEIDGPMVLVVSNVYSPFWKAYVNGCSEKIIHADNVFWGLVLKDNKSEIIFKYEPPYESRINKK